MSTQKMTISSELKGPPSEIQVVPFGTHSTDKGAFTLDSESMKEVISNFNSRENDLVIDYEHQSLGEGEAPAAGWIKRLFSVSPEGSRRDGTPPRSAGIWAVVEWTPRAVQYFRNREYRYLSPVFLKRISDNRVARLLSAALTNTPAIDGMVPVVNRALPGAKGSMTPEPLRKEGKVMEKLLHALGLSNNASEDEAIEAIVALKATGTRVATGEIFEELGLGQEATTSEAVGTIVAMKQAQGQLVELDALRTEVSELRGRLSAKEGEALVAEAMKAGKITPAQKDWAASYAERDPEGFKTFVAKAPVIVPQGELHALKSQVTYEAEGPLQLSVNRLLMVSSETFNKFSKRED